ncbi:MAG: AAA family ATPase [Lachnospiraceae bacterium]|nr:AAA family ATPase [Lachnospiraceae bacterium]
MRIERIQINHFKSIQHLQINDIENSLILVGQNNTGKTTILDAIRTVGGDYRLRPEDFSEDGSNIEIAVSLAVEEEDLIRLQQSGSISRYHRLDAWKSDFRKKLPSYKEGILSFTFVANRNGGIRYEDGFRKNNPYIQEVFPKIYYVDAERNLAQFQNDMLLLQEDAQLKKMRANCCIFDQAKRCNHCFSCIGLINQKNPEKLTAFEALKLLDYKLYQLNLDQFAKKVNDNFRKNGGQEQVLYSMNRDVKSMLTVTTEIYHAASRTTRPIERMGKGMRSIYMLSLLETYAEDENQSPSIIMIEDPEIFLHPTLQRTSGDILYRLSKKHQVIFSTHSPNLLPNFNSRQIRQMVTGADGFPAVREKTDISVILDDLGYTANDLMNVNFVFIVEGKQDKSRLPLLLRKYYSEMYDREGRLSRIAIITTNSCTNIKTYANLKYMNQIYIKDQFLMIRDGDGKDPNLLKKQLCAHYEEQNLRDADHLPRVTPKNVLVLHYYSFENYFLNPHIMCALGVIDTEEAFYEIFLEKWKEYLYRLKSGRQLRERIGADFETIQDVKAHMEDIKVCMRGHNLFDIFYGRFKEQENELLERYVELAPREDFADILDAIDRFIYFESRKRGSVSP